MQNADAAGGMNANTHAKKMGYDRIATAASCSFICSFENDDGLTAVTIRTTTIFETEVRQRLFHDYYYYYCLNKRQQVKVVHLAWRFFFFRQRQS